MFGISCVSSPGRSRLTDSVAHAVDPSTYSHWPTHGDLRVAEVVARPSQLNHIDMYQSRIAVVNSGTMHFAAVNLLFIMLGCCSVVCDARFVMPWICADADPCGNDMSVVEAQIKQLGESWSMKFLSFTVMHWWFSFVFGILHVVSDGVAQNAERVACGECTSKLCAIPDTLLARGFSQRDQLSVLFTI